MTYSHYEVHGSERSAEMSNDDIGGMTVERDMSLAVVETSRVSK